MKLCGYIPDEGGRIHVLAGLASPRENSRFHIESPLASFSSQKKLAKSDFQICFNGKMHSTTF
jgi:hypothetical protein